GAFCTELSDETHLASFRWASALASIRRSAESTATCLRSFGRSAFFAGADGAGATCPATGLPATVALQPEASRHRATTATNARNMNPPDPSSRGIVSHGGPALYWESRGGHRSGVSNRAFKRT